MQATKRKPSLAVHLHLYYQGMWDNIKNYLKNMGNYKYRLYVTMAEENPSLTDEIKAFHPETEFFVTSNRGYDVGPFIDMLKRADLCGYDLILKIHTKNCRTGVDTLINNRFIDRLSWFRLLMGGVLGSPELFEKNIKRFAEDKTLGMVGSRYLITSAATTEEEYAEIRRIMARLGYDCPQKITFVAGTMFMARGSLLRAIRDNFSLADFEQTDGAIHAGTLAHLLERLFGCVIEAQGYKIACSDKKNWRFLCYNKTRALKRFFYHKKVTSGGKLLIKICKIPVFSRKLGD